MRRLKPEQFDLLTQVVTKHHPELLPLLNVLGKRPLSIDEREELRDAVLKEFCSVGLQEDDEPNQIGMQLDDIIGVLGHY